MTELVTEAEAGETRAERGDCNTSLEPLSLSDTKVVERSRRGGVNGAHRPETPANVKKRVQLFDGPTALSYHLPGAAELATSAPCSPSQHSAAPGLLLLLNADPLVCPEGDKRSDNELR